MAPENRADSPLSRFTCEACHFEGYVDGRTHHTGRGSVRATTKPLLGLFNNRAGRGALSAHGFAHGGTLEGSTTLPSAEQAALLRFLMLL